MGERGSGRSASGSGRGRRSAAASLFGWDGTLSDGDGAQRHVPPDRGSTADRRSVPGRRPAADKGSSADRLPAAERRTPSERRAPARDAPLDRKAGSRSTTARSGSVPSSGASPSVRSGGRADPPRRKPGTGAPRAVPPRPPARRPGTGAGGGRPPNRPARPRPPASPPPEPHAVRFRRRARVTVCGLSTLVLVLTGSAWGLYRDITGGLTTTNVITGGANSGEQNILLVGVDSRTDAQGDPLPRAVLDQLHGGESSGVLNSDTIIVLHVPDDGGSATAFSIPRDSYVDIPGYRKDKINAAYPVTKALRSEELVRAGGMNPKEIDSESSAAGRSTLIQTVQDLTGLRIDHYAEVNLLGFYNLTEAIGGVDVCLRNPVNDAFSGANFPAGPQTVSGAAALSFVRQRHGLPEGDLSRIRRQQVFLAAVADKTLSSGTLTNPSTLSGLIDVAHKSLVVDSGWDLLGFARQASGLAAGNLNFLTIPTQGGSTNDRGDVVLVDPAQVKGFVEQQTTPADERPEETPEPEETPDVDPAGVTADVGNGSGTTGLAAQVAGTLTAAGFVEGSVENAPSRTTSVVRYAQSDGDAAARAVAAKLGGIGVEQADGVASGHVQVLLGTDFEAPAAAAAPTASPSAATSAPAPDAGSAINAGGVPCID
jgi:LCP family protein required for cell wall assembly